MVNKTRQQEKGKKIRELKIQVFFNYTEKFLSSDFLLHKDIATGHVLV